MGNFKISWSQCQQKQMWEQMVMTKNAFLLEGESLIPPLALVLELLDQKRTVPLINNRGRTGQCFPNLQPRRSPRTEAIKSLTLASVSYLTRKWAKGGRGCHRHALDWGLEPHHLFLCPTTTQGSRCYPHSPGEGLEALRGEIIGQIHTAGKR